MFYWLVRNFFRILFIPLFRYKIEGAHNIPRTGAVILAANHRSYTDPVLIAIAMKYRRLNSMTKASLIEKPVLGWALRQLGGFPVKIGVADKAALVRSLKVLGERKVLLVFPEGTRYKKGGMGPVYAGAFTIALKTGTPIVPIGIIGTDLIMPPGAKIPRLPKLRVKVGEPVPVPKIIGPERKEKEAELTAQIMERIAELSEGH